MNPCMKYAALLDGFVDGELSPEEVLQVREHLDRCPACQSYVDDALAIRAAFPQVEETEVPEGFAEAVSAAIRAQTPVSKQKKAAPWMRAALPLAACCALVILLSRLPGSPMKMRDMSGAGVSSAADTAAPAAAEDSMDAECALEEPAASADEAETWKSLTEGFSPSSVQSPGAQLDTANAGEAAGTPAAYSENKDTPSGGTGATPETSMAPRAANDASADAEKPAASPAVNDTAQDGGRSAAPKESEPEPAAVTAAQGEEGWVEHGNVVFASLAVLDKDFVGDALSGFEGKPYSDANQRSEGVLGTGYALEPEEFERILSELGYPLGPVLNPERTTELCCIVVVEE